MGSNGSDETPRKGGTDDTIPASEPPRDVHGAPMRGSRASIPPGTTQRYRMGVELGRGGMGRVVEAFDTQLGRTGALKEALPKGAPLSRRFLREIEITARLEHASIVPIYDSGTTADGRPFYVMRRVTGRPLEELIRRARTLDERLTLLPHVLAASDAVAHAHARGVIHRDLKPANILVGELGETVVIDWGLAKVLGDVDVRSGSDEDAGPADSLQTQVGSVFGTPGFMPPEQARGEEQTTRGDVYALGATLYHLLAGTPPHGGTSATSVLAGTLSHDVVPLGEAAPRAPAQRGAIAQKAMGFEAEARYPNAGELAEDVRRFLTGQLVAAHQYTSRQRLVRFARRHRTALVVAALATVAVAVLAWFSVHRILLERDAAQQARVEALEGRRAAEQARDALADRNDALLITQARALVDTNPTEAMAVLKQLGSSSSRLPEARALAQAAVMRGVWTAIEAADVFATTSELSADGRLLLRVGRDHVLRIYDLDTKRLRIARPLDTASLATWLDGGRVLVYGSTRPSAVLDPAANSLVELAGPSLRWVEVSEDGRTALVQYADNTSALVEVATWKATPLPLADVRDLELAPDGTWCVIANPDRAVAFAADGTELHRVDFAAPMLRIGPSRTYAVWSPERVLRCTLAPKPACVEVASPAPSSPFLDVIFRGEHLFLESIAGELLLWADGQLRTSARIDQVIPRMGEAAGEVLVVPSQAGTLTVRSAALDTTIPVPVAVSHPRLLTRRTSSRLVLAGDGLILVTDLADVLPRLVPDTRDTEAFFVDDSTLLTWHPSGSGWSWLDLETGARTRFDVSLRGFPAFLDADRTRILVREGMTAQGRLLLLEKGKPPAQIAEGKDVAARLLGTDDVVFAVGGRVQVQRGTERAREIVKLDGAVVAISALGRDGFVALGDHGEVVRVALATSAIERTRIDLVGESFVTSDPVTHRALIVSGDRISAWDTHVREIARFDRPIRQTSHASDGRLIVILADNDVHLVDPRGGRPSERLLAGAEQMPTVSRDGALLVGAGKGMQVHVVETSPVARWTLPKAFTPTNDLSLSPSSRYVVQRFVSALKVLRLPQVSPDFQAWLDEHTNAVKGRDDVLVWPWQVRGP